MRMTFCMRAKLSVGERRGSSRIAYEKSPHISVSLHEIRNMKVPCNENQLFLFNNEGKATLSRFIEVGWLCYAKSAFQWLTIVSALFLFIYPFLQIRKI